MIAIAALALTPAPALAQEGSLTISPSEAEGVAVKGARIGPLGVTNTTQARYSMEVFPVLVGQDTEGALLVRQDPSSLKQAGRLLRVAGEPAFELEPGESQSVAARLVRTPPSGSFYGGILFQGTPEGTSGSDEVTQILQLNARVFLEPAPQRTRSKGELTDVRVEQASAGRLTARVSFANIGNTELRPRGQVAIRDEAGDVRLRRPVTGLDVIPGASVDLPVDLGRQVLPEGSYELEAAISAGDQRLRLRRPLELFGPNTVATQAAEIISFEPPQAEAGVDAEVMVRYRNSGNVAFTPDVELSVSGVDDPLTMAATEIAPGDEAEASGSIQLDGRDPRQLTVRLLAGDRELDKRSVTVTPTAARSASERFSDWVTENALMVVAALIVLIVAMGVGFVLVVRRRAARP